MRLRIIVNTKDMDYKDAVGLYLMRETKKYQRFVSQHGIISTIYFCGGRFIAESSLLWNDPMKKDGKKCILANRLGES